MTWKSIGHATLAVAMMMAASSAAVQRSGDQGYGFMVGNPTGFSTKVWLDENFAFDGAAGIARSEFDLHVSLLWHHFRWTDRVAGGWMARITEAGEFPFYIGIGPRLLFEDDREWGIRFPVGLSFLPHQSNWEFFTEVAPVLRVTPHTGFNGDFAAGVRYYFRTIRPRAPYQ